MASISKRRRHNNEYEPMDTDQGIKLTKEHQLLLQYLIHARMTKKRDLSQIHGRLFSDDESLSESISTITNHISSLKMDIKQVKCDISGETYFTIIHTTSELFFPKCCRFSKNQLDFLKQVLTSIVLSTNGKIGKIAALNTSKNVSKSEADECLGLFVKEKLLTEINNSGQFCLTPLTIAEFGPFFSACFPNNLSTCDLCKQLVFVGKICGNPSCEKKFHLHCASKWMEKRSVCPKCDERWNNENDMSADTE